ncbi:MAG: hypothetical protein AAF993_10100 [Pseudomonadota bacterium]
MYVKLLVLGGLICIAGCDADSAPEFKTVYSTPHKFDPNLQGLQRLWAQQAEQQLASGVQLDRNNQPANIDTTATVISATGRYRGHLTPAPDQVNNTARFSFSLDLEAVDQAMPEQLTLAVAGGMPMHSHGLPTQPTLIVAANGRIEIEGVRFSMPGWWQLAIGIAQDDSASYDMLTFNFLVRP